MLTFFTTAKPFRGHDGIIQRNGLQSWKLLDPEVEVILFGDEAGAAEASAELGLRHEPHVERYQGKMPYVNFLFRRAQEIARHDYLCYSNCDIVLSNDFLNAFKKARAWRQRFLMISRRWDTDVTEPIDFSSASWALELRKLALTTGFQQDEHFMDLFLFTKGLFLDVLPLIVGYCYWDDWMIWKALNTGVAVLDCSSFALAVHQNHGYTTTPERFKGSNLEPLSMRNMEIVGGWEHIRNIRDATHRLTRRGWIVPNPARLARPWEERYRPMLQHLVCSLWNPIWFFFLDMTRPVRSVLGLRSKANR